MSIYWGDIFDAYGTKVVSATDKSKAAYVPTSAQCEVIAKAGIVPSSRRPAEEFRVSVLNDTMLSIGASFYHSQRDELKRTPEPRMGHAFIRSWLQVGDTVLLGVVNKELFALKVNALLSEEGVKIDVVNRGRPETIMARALRAKGQPERKMVIRDDFVRDPYVVKAALIRSGNRCEMPSCATLLFQRDDGRSYVEVHHVIPLGEGGDDSLANVASLCPRCHREQHFGSDRKAKRGMLKLHVDGISLEIFELHAALKR